MSISSQSLENTLSQSLAHLHSQQNTSQHQIRLPKHIFIQLHAELYEITSQLPLDHHPHFLSLLQNVFIDFYVSYAPNLSLECFCSIERMWERLWNGRISFLSSTDESGLLAMPRETYLQWHHDHGHSQEASCVQGILKYLHERNERGNNVQPSLLPETPQQKPHPKWRFTRTKNHVQKCDDLSLTSAHSTGEKLSPTVTHYPGLGLWIDNVLSHTECQMLMQLTDERGYKSLENEFLSTERDSCRLLLLCDTLANELWERIEPFLHDYDTKPYGFLSHGTWRAKSINPCMRFCKYAPSKESVGFTIHRDGNYVVSESERSALSLLIYLNDEDFEGGETVFFTSHSGARPNETIKEELERGYSQYKSFRPKAGACLLFESTWLHSGAPITRGAQSKYILRSDVLFARDTRTRDMPQRLLRNRDYQLMNALYQEAEEWETHGNVEKSSELYERALSVRMGQSSVDA